MIRKFFYFENFDGGSIKFFGKEVAPICDKGTISIDGKHKTNNVYYVKGLRQNILSVIHM